MRSLFIVLLLTGIILPGLTMASTTNNVSNDVFSHAVNKYKSGDYKSAAHLFAQSKGINARTGEAMSHFNLKNYNSAAALFLRTVILAVSDRQRFEALYNAASCYYRSGNYHLASYYYEEALRYIPGEKNAVHFLSLSQHIEKIINEARQSREREGKKSSEDGVATNIDGEINPDDRLTLDESETRTSLNTKQLDKALRENQALKPLVISGLESLKQIRMRGSTPSSTLLTDDFKGVLSSDYLDNITPEQSFNTGWKRLFETEAGFPTLLETPEQIPGSQSW